MNREGETGDDLNRSKTAAGGGEHRGDARLSLSDYRDI